MGTSGDGWAALNIDELDAGYMRKVRDAAGISAFGINVLTVPPRTHNRFHRHSTQQEVYFVHEGELTIEFEDGTATAGPGGVIRVDAAAFRRIANHGAAPAIVVAIGGSEGYVGRDGELRADELEAVGAGGPMIGLPLSDF